MSIAQINQYQLARLLGVHQTAVSGWLTRKCGISDENISKLVDIIGDQNVRILKNLCNSLAIDELQESLKRKFEVKKGGR
ncbi:helix-turn-helix transcriptional regulator [Bacillus cereus]|uniref:helix-turn-helix domain-containing protein n=1 Tax=Bacillus cereus TaxID=1396 RepID=UPI002406C499|nr:helix-turn-helix transcriptional regulator [Bacillus cereus]MDF9615149.1 helix-turn-helix transcriptional regulator [Bacillus cereus]